ncbi:hypothetical protein V5O48_001577 [Marasmius crinis-equi]|uniref:SET domain-containing protein n=1 Tax=Marasmius crinis-equi TaxID=585013 RepID=A0ABR3FXZ4_9AGAR
MKRGFLKTAKGKQAISITPVLVGTVNKRQAIRPVSTAFVNKGKTIVSLSGPDNAIGTAADVKSLKKQTYDDERIVFTTEEVDGARRILEPSPGDCVDYEPSEVVYTTVPPRTQGETAADNPDGWTECLVTGHIKEEIFKAPGFPKPLTHPAEESCRIGDSPGKGQGVFATRALEMGDLIFSERPIVVFPARELAASVWLDNLPSAQIAGFIEKEWEGILKHMMKRATSEKASAFWALENVHPDLDKMKGIVRTNGFKALGVAGLTKEERDEEDDYSNVYEGVCEKLCRINHSCQPNCERSWDKASFSFQIRATRKVEAGEELFIMYTDNTRPYAERKQQLDLFKFRCTCDHCSNPERSDARREAYASAMIPRSAFTEWVTQKLHLPDNHIVNKCLKQIQMLEEDGLENSPWYKDHLTMILYSYIVLGDRAKAKEWGQKFGRWKSFRYGPEEALRYSEDRFYSKENELWQQRLKAKAKALRSKRT